MQTLISRLDHVLVHSSAFERDVENYTLLLGAPPEASEVRDGVRSAVFDAGNTRLVLGESTKENGLTGLCLGVTDRERLHRRLERLGLAAGATEEPDPIAMPGDPEPAGRITWLAPDTARGLRLGFVARAGSAEPGTPERVAGLDHAVIASADAERTAFLLGACLGLDLRADMHRPQWNARLMFFRCGDLILEVFQVLDAEAATPTAAQTPGPERDGFYGLSWRVGDAAQARAQLDAAGFDVSPVRGGRKPGTEVFTVRDRSAGVATLMLGKARAGA